MSMKRSLAFAVGSQGFIFLFGFSNAVLSAQILGPEGKGQLAIYMLALDLGAALMVLGMNQALHYHAARGDFATPRTLNTAMVFAALCATAFLVLLQGAFVVGQGGRFLPAPFNSGVFRGLITAHFFLSFSWMLLGAILNSHKLFKEGYRVTLISISCLCCLYAGLLALQRFGLVEVTVAHIYACLVSVALMSLVLGLRVYSSDVRLISKTPGGLLKRREILTLASFGVFPWISQFMMRAVAKIDYWFVEVFVGLEALGQYSVAANIGETLYLIPNTIGIVVLSFIADPETRVDSTHRTATMARLFFPTMLVGAVVVSTFSTEMFSFAFGPDFAGAGPIFNVMLWGIVPFSLGTICLGYLIGANQLKPVVAAAAMGLALTIVLNLVLIPRFGIIGAAATRALAFSAMTAFLVVRFKRVSGLPYSRFLWPSRADIAVIRKLLTRRRQT